jgi:hypothetical protein
MTTAPLVRRWNTLAILKRSRVAVLALDALLLVAIVVGTGVHRAAMQTIGNDTAPSIIAAQRIKASLADMDANAANQLLGPPNAASPASAIYDKRRVEASKALIEAAKNITYGDAEQVPIETLQVSTGTYVQLIQQALDQQNAGQSDLSLLTYRRATGTMNRTLLPAADALDRANDAEMERTYTEESRHSLMARVLVFLIGMFTLALLVATQVFLARRMHRLLNPFLLAATLVTLWVTFLSFGSFGDEERHLKVAKEDAFTSIRALSRARAVAYAANGDESRYLLDRAGAAEYERGFFEKSRLLVNLPQSTDIRQAIAAAARGQATPGLTGYLADELNNITFPGEREAAVATFAAFERYLTVDAQIRQLERAGQHQEAVALCTGSSEGQSDWAFDQFDQALLKTLAINRNAFDRSVQEGFSDVDRLEIKAAVAAAVIAIFVALGLAIRIREYE